MSAQPVKGSLARRVTLPIPCELDYPATRQATVSIPSRIARDPRMALTHLRLIIELASAGADSQWILLPSLAHLSRCIDIHPAPISRAIYALEEAHYIEIKRQTRMTRYVRMIASAYALDWE